VEENNFDGAKPDVAPKDDFSDRHLQGSGGITEREIEEAIDKIWDELRSDQDARNAANAAGVPVAGLNLNSPTHPFKVRQIKEGFEPATQFVISIGAGLVVHFSKRAIDPLWDKYVAPKLVRILGGRVRPSSKR